MRVEQGKLEIFASKVGIGTNEHAHGALCLTHLVYLNFLYVDAYYKKFHVVKIYVKVKYLLKISKIFTVIFMP